MLHTVTKYTCIFTSRICRLALEITFLLKKLFFLQRAYELLSQNGKPNEQRGGEDESKLQQL